MKYDPAEVPDNVVKVKVARCDVAKNDVPVEVYGVPSVKLFPAGKKDMPVEFFGSQTRLHDYEEFIFGETDAGLELRASRRNTPESDRINGNDRNVIETKPLSMKE